MNRLRVKFETWDRYLFLLCVIVNLIPTVHQFFPTMDGPTHLYNSNIINGLLLDNHFLKNYYMLSSEPIPNWTGHFFLSIFNLFLPAFVAEKLLVVTYLVALPYSFKYFLKALGWKNGYLSYFVFPFTYSFLFLLGFYNFSIALILLFVTLRFWIVNENKFSSIRIIFYLGLLITLTYFSHLFIFVLLILILSLYILVKGYNKSGSNHFKSIVRKFGILGMSSCIPLVFGGYYFITRKGTFGATQYISFGELLRWLQEIRPTIVYKTSIEAGYTRILFVVSMLMFVIALYGLVRKQFQRISSRRAFRFDIWLLLVFTLLVLYFSVPDSLASAGYVSVRLGLLFFLFLVTWLSTQDLPAWLKLGGILIALYSNFNLTFYYSTVMEELNQVAAEYYDMSDHLEPNTVVLPLDYSDDWRLAHSSNYLGVEKPIVVLENYECDTGYFPVKWNDRRMPNLLLGETSSQTHKCLTWKSNNKNESVEIDYVFVMGYDNFQKDSCYSEIKGNLTKHFVLVKTGEYSQLYRRKLLKSN